MIENFHIVAVEQQAPKPANSAASSIEMLPFETSGQDMHIGCCIISTCSYIVICLAC